MWSAWYVTEKSKIDVIDLYHIHNDPPHTRPPPARCAYSSSSATQSSSTLKRTVLQQHFLLLLRTGRSAGSGERAVIGRRTTSPAVTTGELC